MLVRARGFGMHHDQTCMHRTYTVYNSVFWSKQQNLTPPAQYAFHHSLSTGLTAWFVYISKTYMHEAPNGKPDGYNNVFVFLFKSVHAQLACVRNRTHGTIHTAYITP
jgi:hypothetical protein